MNVLSFNERSCERYRRYFDAYLDSELLVETNQDVLQHVASCRNCRKILDARARVKQLVKQAVTRNDAPLKLAFALRERIRTERRGFFAFSMARWLMAATAVVALAIGSVAALEWGRVGPILDGERGGPFQTVFGQMIAPILYNQLRRLEL